MQFVVWTPAGPETFDGDASFRVADDGVLIVDDPRLDKRTTFSSTGWLKVEQQRPTTAYDVVRAVVRRGDNDPSAATKGS